MSSDEHNPILSSCVFDGEKLERLLVEAVVNPDAPQRGAADVVPRYAFERAMDIINGLVDAYKESLTALAEAKPDQAGEIGAHLTKVLDSVYATMREIGTPPR